MAFRPLHKRDTLYLSIILGFSILFTVFFFSFEDYFFSETIYLLLVSILILLTLFILLFRERLGLLIEIEFLAFWGHKVLRTVIIGVLVFLLIVSLIFAYEANKWQFIMDSWYFSPDDYEKKCAELPYYNSICYISNGFRANYETSMINDTVIVLKLPSMEFCESIPETETFPWWFGIADFVFYKIDIRAEMITNLYYMKSRCISLSVSSN